MVRKVGRVCTEECAWSGRPRCGSPQRAVAVAARATASPASGAGKPAPSPAAPITGSCFCLALRRSVCPNPQLLPGLDLLPPLPSPPCLPARSAGPRRVCATVALSRAQVPGSRMGEGEGEQMSPGDREAGSPPGEGRARRCGGEIARPQAGRAPG